MTDILLSVDQERAVKSVAPALVVVAGAGSGKTEVVARRIERLLKESEEDGYRILAVSYTVKAADELGQRLATRLGDHHRRVDTDTIHGFALSLLRQHGTRVGLPTEPEILGRDEDRVELLGAWLAQAGQSWPADPSAVLTQIDLARARCESAPLLEEWRDALSATGALDYAAMLDRAVELAEEAWTRRHLRRIYRHVIVDEAQNLTRAQYRLLTQIIGEPYSEHLHAMMVGDERQSIVGFAGADASLISQFASEYRGERIELHTNYRSARRVVQVGCAVAHALGQPTEALSGLDFPAEGSVSVQVCATEEAEGQFLAGWIANLLSNGLDPSFVAPGESTTVQAEEIAVLARAATSLRSIRDALAAIKIESAMASTEAEWVASSPAKAIVEIVAYRSAPDHVSTRRRLAKLCGSDEVDWDRPRLLIRSATDPYVAMLSGLEVSDGPDELLRRAETLEIDDPDWSGDLDQLKDAWLSFADRTNASDRTFGNFRHHIARCQRGDSLSPGVRLLTVHKAQGREFKAVAVMACNDGQFPDFRAATADAAVSELRTFYVAVSRPARSLLLTRATRRRTRYGYRPTDPSAFLAIVGSATGYGVDQ